MHTHSQGAVSRNPRRHPCLIPRVSAEARGAPGLTLLSAQGVHAVAPQPRHYPNVLPASSSRGNRAPSPTRAPAAASPSWPGSQPAHARIPRLSPFHSSFGLLQSTFCSHHITHQNSSVTHDPVSPPPRDVSALRFLNLRPPSDPYGHLPPKTCDPTVRCQSCPRALLTAPSLPNWAPSPYPSEAPPGSRCLPGWGAPRVCVQLPSLPHRKRRWNLTLSKAKTELGPPPAAPSPCPAVPTPRAARGREHGRLPQALLSLHSLPPGHPQSRHLGPPPGPSPQAKLGPAPAERRQPLSAPILAPLTRTLQTTTK
ncbi:basic proline-rich protein-like [Sagmatias obliquidens]|uniref:basic proline-rich protein-like n=1 Tax=Sagmatias obliquidens TaxID=3371155 RepID=UPI000F443646|nr:basic proline-rich protein-like [Lagenorhynchus obliquidens]